ncbi:hypothetical protein L226DRAFT_142577 [Lentinus tigrinus ALCF2SS1-7]|uniref:uncharacterized protein n=1 Tax=Lentinus tigrinus ALCF2SS1-7 TaxID=1328758 RepID=UPI0011663AFF|nr:hypothetical protein L226DRAFT_142577 [Lentinus tigrinus ALCF2SS1-7]
MRFDREEGVETVRLQARYAELENCYERFMREHGPVDEAYDERCYPNRHDGALLFLTLAHRDNARISIDYDTFASDLALLREKFYGYELNIQAGLSSLLPDFSGFTSILRKPHAMFSCPKCGMTALPWPDINVHWCKEHSTESIWAVSLLRRPVVKWWRGGEDVANRILDAAGLNREWLIYWLNALIEEGRLYCNCGDPSFGPAHRQPWAQLVFHVYTHLRMNEDRHRDQADGSDEHVWRNDHVLKDCIRCIPESDGKVEALQMRYVSPEPSVLARVDAHLAQCPSGFVPVCRLCKEMTHKDKDLWMVLPPRANAISYHMTAKAFNEDDILFENLWYLPRHQRHIFHWGVFALEEKISWEETRYV